ncbi:MAG: hypothetical protein H6931_10470 [Burkholderiaceae bacterium]|jgi:hypothetical protein|nr:hypothetical protein [Burkholderiaceae bacterium]
MQTLDGGVVVRAHAPAADDPRRQTRDASGLRLAGALLIDAEVHDLDRKAECGREALGNRQPDRAAVVVPDRRG